MRSAVRAHPFLAYYLLALAIAIAVTVISETWGKHSPAADPLSYWHYAQAHNMVLNAISIAAFGLGIGGPFVFLVFLFGGAPTISALVTVTVGWGRRGLARLISRLKPWRGGVTSRQALRVYGILIGVYLAGLVFSLWFTKTYGSATEIDYTWKALGQSPLLVLLIGLASLLFDEGSSFEELGWRGFAQPYLQLRIRLPLVAAVLLGVLWWAWHLPREMPAILTGHNWLGGAFQPLVWARSESLFLLYVVLLSIVIAYGFNLTGGSVWPAILIHAGTNAWSKTGAMAAMYRLTHWPIDLRAIFMLAIVALILVFAGPRLGVRSDLDDVDGGESTGLTSTAGSNSESSSSQLH
jgi:hypothetical protein